MVPLRVLSDTLTKQPKMRKGKVSPMSNLKLQPGLFAAAALFATATQAEVLLTVDLSVVNQVTISATGGLAANTVSGDVLVGVYLENFYASEGGALFGDIVSGDLSNAENPSNFDPYLWRGGSGSDMGLNIYNFSDDPIVTFTAGSLAFVGSATWDLDANEYADMLAGSGLGGDVYFPADLSDDVTNAAFLGTYSVFVPAPGVLPLLGIGLGTGVIRRRR